MTIATLAGSIIVIILALLWQWQLRSDRIPPRPTNPLVAEISDRFQKVIEQQQQQQQQHDSSSLLQITKRGVLNWDLDTFVWNRLAEKFGSNPNTPYMYNILPLSLFGLPLPSPMWTLQHYDAVVLILERPPPVEYFSFTTFCLGSLKRGLVFASLGDSLNSHSPKMMKQQKNNNSHDNDDNIFAHVVVTEKSYQTLSKIQSALIQSGIVSIESNIHVAVIPNTVASENEADGGMFGGFGFGGPFYEVVLRIFRFHNQTEGDRYLQSKQPVFYIKGTKPNEEEGGGGDKQQTQLLPKPTYRDRSHPDNVNEPALFQKEFVTYQETLVDYLQNQISHHHHDPDTTTVQTVSFGPLLIRGLDCLKNIGHQCLGDCPDAAYYGSNIVDNSDNIESLKLKGNDEFHLLTVMDHRQTGSSIYSSIALLRTHKPILNKTKLDVRGTSIGILSNHEYHHNPSSSTTNTNTTITTTTTTTTASFFFSWIFTRNPDHCLSLVGTSSSSSSSQIPHGLIRGCTVIDEKEVPRNSYFAYCERLYLNPITGTGPDWKTILPAKLYHFQNVKQVGSSIKPEVAQLQSLLYSKQRNAELFARIRLPSSKDVQLAVFKGDQKLKFLHIIKTGGESFEGYLGSSPTMIPQMDYPVCRKASISNLTSSLPPVLHGSSSSVLNSTQRGACWAMTTTISSLLCGLNCECCANDIHEPAGGGGFHGTLLRSPRSHTLSLFSHGHTAHFPTWGRMFNDFSLYLAERVLFAAELICGHSGTGGVRDWKVAFEDNLKQSLSLWPATTEVQQQYEGVQVISLRNTQSHSLTCSKRKRGSSGQHFRILPSPDSLEPDLNDTLATLNRLEWVGITDLFHPSLCLLHYQANQTLPIEACDCRHPNHHTNDAKTKPLGYWVEYRTKRGRSLDELSAEVLELIDQHTTIDSQLFAAALRLLLGRLRKVEELTAASILECIDWQKLKRKTDYIPGLWTGGPDSLLLTAEEQDKKQQQQQQQIEPDVAAGIAVEEPEAVDRHVGEAAVEEEEEGVEMNARKSEVVQS